MQPRQQAAEGSQGETGTEMPIAQAANETGQAIVQRAYRRIGPTPGVIPLDVSRQLATRGARPALGQLPLLESIQRRWGPSANGSWGNWPQLLYLQRELGVAAPAGWAGEADAGWGSRLSSPTRDPLPIVSAGPTTRAGTAGLSTPAVPAREPTDAVNDSAAGLSDWEASARRLPGAVTGSAAAAVARTVLTTPGTLAPTGTASPPRPTPAGTTAVTPQGSATRIQASTVAPGSLPVVRGLRAPTARPHATARDVAAAATPPLAVAKLHRSPEQLHEPTAAASPALGASPPDVPTPSSASDVSLAASSLDATTPSATSDLSLGGAGTSLQDNLSGTSRATPAALPVIRPTPRAAHGQRKPEPSAGETAPVATSGPGPSSAPSTGMPAPLALRPGPAGPQPQPGVIARWGEPIVQRSRAGCPSVQPVAGSAIPGASAGSVESVLPRVDQNPVSAYTSLPAGVNTPAAAPAPTAPAPTAASAVTPVVQVSRRPAAEHPGPVGLAAGGTLARVPAPGQAQPSAADETAPAAAPAPTAASTVTPVVQVSRRPAVERSGPVGLTVGRTLARVPAPGQAQPSAAGETAPAAADVLSRAPARSQAQAAGTPAVEGRTISVAQRAAPTPGVQALTVPDATGPTLPRVGHPTGVVRGHVLARRSNREDPAPAAGYNRAGTIAGQPGQQPAFGTARRSGAPASEPPLVTSGEPASQGAPAVAAPTPAVVVRPSDPVPWVARKAAGAAETLPAVTHLSAAARAIVTASRPRLGDRSVPVTPSGIEAPGLLRALDNPTEQPLVVPAWPATGDRSARGVSEVPAAASSSSEPGFSWRGGSGNAAAGASSAPAHVTASSLPVAIQRQANSAPPSPASAPPTGPPAAPAPEPASAAAKSLRLEDMDLERVARAVYDLLEQRLRFERECRGL